MRYILDKHGLEDFIERYENTEFTVKRILDDLKIDRSSVDFRMNAIRIGSILIKMAKREQVYIIRKEQVDGHGIWMNVYSLNKRQDWSVLA